MKEKLEWLAGNMPDGYSLSLYYKDEHGVTTWQLRCPDLDDLEQDILMNPAQGDIGLAPLTALLKQEIVKREEMAVEYPCLDVSREVYSDKSVFACSMNSNIPGVGDTEFDAVYQAYKEKQ